jgi:hypothetical protein
METPELLKQLDEAGKKFLTNNEWLVDSNGMWTHEKYQGQPLNQLDALTVHFGCYTKYVSEAMYRQAIIALCATHDNDTKTNEKK